MKSDIIVPAVQDVVVAAVPRGESSTEELWDVYIINLREDDLENVLVTSQGYGTVDGRDMSTTVLRHFHQQLPGRQALKVEPIQTSLFGLKNEYWISFNADGVMLDKKFIFQPGTISVDKLETVPVIDRPGVFIK